MTQFLIQLLPLILVGLLFVFPVAKISKKAGYSPLWALVFFLPLANIIAIWIFAFSDWPNLRQDEEIFR